MRKLTLLIFMLLAVQLSALEKLPQQYRVTFGNPLAEIKITEYFSFMCPHCIALFRQDFNKIKKELIDGEEIYWEFHPVPQDLTTVQAMICLDKLTQEQRRLFLIVMLEEADITDPVINARLMQKAMEIFDSPLPDLEDKEFMTKSQAFVDAFEFIKQEDRIAAIPTVEINNKLFNDEIPDFAFIQKKVEELKK